MTTARLKFHIIGLFITRQVKQSWNNLEKALGRIHNEILIELSINTFHKIPVLFQFGLHAYQRMHFL